MDASQFDRIARELAVGRSRRSLIKGLGAAALGGLGLARLGAADADTLCKPATPLAQAKCTKDAQCCAGLVCQGGRCQGGCRIGGTFYASGATNPANQCQSCQPATSTTGWTNQASGTTCNDGNACTRTDTCDGAGHCVGGNPVVCTASDQCHVAGTCDPTSGLCSNPAKADGTACDDGDACTTNDVCTNGVCGGTPVVCTASDQCHVAGTCDPATGTCSNPNAPDGTACNDGDACTQTDTCQSGSCVGSNPVICSDDRECIGGACQCPAGTHDCGSECTDLCSTNPDYYRNRFQVCMTDFYRDCARCTSWMGCYGSIHTQTCGTVTAGC